MKSEIRDGIEFFELPGGISGEQCARCGSSVDWVDCWNCDDGEIERDSWDGIGEGYFVRCEICRGKGGHWACLSSREWCVAHPRPGRENIESTAYEADADD